LATRGQEQQIPVTGADSCDVSSGRLVAPVDNEIVKLRDLRHATSILVTHQIRDAFYIATHEAVRRHGQVRIVRAGEQRAVQSEFMVLHDGRIQFEGSATELLVSRDPYLRSFLSRTLPPW
jgi:phospholipid/cholesterol/gamma-HCH transport system ATP-binding protein